MRKSKSQFKRLEVVIVERDCCLPRTEWLLHPELIDACSNH